HRATSKNNLERHENSHFEDKDPRKKKYECGICGNVCNDPSALTRHKRIHEDVTELQRPYPCTKCNKRFRIKSHLDTHMNIH
ncbi:hypothetical protein PMAYCL1PPCAC_01105, partial [Pristionchus mayeri]